MPDIYGLEFCKIIHKKYSNILCIIVTAHSNQNIMHKAINQGGIFQFIIKPWDTDTLKQTIENAIEKFNLVKQNRQLFIDLELKNKELSEKNEVLTITSEVLKENEQELIRNNKELIKAKDKAEESDRLKTSFLANISHEIRTPMNGILGFIELLVRSKNEKLSEKGKSYIKIIKQSSNQLVSIINDLIDISKIEAGVLLIKEDEFEVNEILGSIIRDYKHKFDQNHIHFNIQNFLNGQQICTDKHKMLQILKHLVDNALKYTYTGSVAVTIKQQKTQ